ncbi:MAG: hypothetical protein JOZ90_17050 [Alphaproteobacteria bacterium]|nr:hypothetical protein [Alphaproteobacteria bacterium]MBV9371479.1 hypothetical protein [Alphaproteobacteria bacterium]MBV9902779.1 hypothetical protein [Alphaproteobacteria bacterium]
MKLLRVLAELHVFEGRVNRAQPLRLGLELDEGRFLRVRERRGDHVGFDDGPLQPADLGEGGSVEVHDISLRLGPELAGSDLERITTVEDGEGHTIGLALWGSEGVPFYIWIEDDEFQWGSEEALDEALADRGAVRAAGRELLPGPGRD